VSFPLPGQVFIENKTNQYGLLKFVLNSGYLDYAEFNDLMVFFHKHGLQKKTSPTILKGVGIGMDGQGKTMQPIPVLRQNG